MKVNTIGKIESIDMDVTRCPNDDWMVYVILYCYGMDEKRIPVSRKKVINRDMLAALDEARTHIAEMEKYIDALYGEAK